MNEINKTVVRLKTSYWHDSRGMYIRKSLTILKRKSDGYLVAFEDCDNIGADEVLSRITNLETCEDGIYELDTCNEERDWETGYIDDYDYVLCEYVEKGDDVCQSSVMCAEDLFRAVI